MNGRQARFVPLNTVREPDTDRLPLVLQLEIGVEKTVQYDVDGVTIDLSQHAPRPSRNPSTSAK